MRAGVVVAQVAACGPCEVKEAVEAAHQAQKEWGAKTGKARGLVLRKWFELMAENSGDLAFLLTLESGKPTVEAKGEVL